MAKSFVFFVFLIVILIESCGMKGRVDPCVFDNQNYEIIECGDALKQALRDDSFCVDDLIDTVCIVKLETIESSLISTIRYVSVTDSLIYISDINNVLLFRRDGSFIKSIPKGNGPGELFSVQAVTFNDKLNELLVFQNYLINKYTPLGEFVSSVETPFVANEVISLDRGYMFSQYAFQNKQKKYACFTLDSSLNPGNAVVFPREFPDFKPTVTLTHSQNGDINITRNFDECIYLFKNDTLRIKYKLSFSNCALKIEESAGSFNIDKYKCEVDKFYFTGSFAESSNFQQFIFCTGNLRQCTLIRNRENGRLFAGFNSKTPRKTLGSLINPYCYDVFDDFFISSVHLFEGADNAKCLEFADSLMPGKHISQDDIDKIRNIRADDNPLIIMYKLKSIE